MRINFGLADACKYFESMTHPRRLLEYFDCEVCAVGYGEEALKLFETMRSAGIKPNNVTFVGVLSACSHVGLVEEGCNYYKIMESDYGIRPTREHRCCVVDMLARRESEGS
ncbi:hypothetical protein IFM89_018206 [Coptis chinensis]|uniref:Pentatricopeptide repeat-containing protein n=1 Tax=Coptis chinensis TaxID=261450 RepID=A0A835LVI2_9MAGN|nr:hypothetical protein IFM89_018206 [Coptis chinensis]